MNETNYLQDCLNRKVIFFTGKGGVGKSAVAWATALLCKDAGKRVGFVSWNPLDETAKAPALNEFGIPWEILDTMGCFKEYTLNLLKFEKIFDMVFENHVLQTFVKAMPGLSETVIAGKIWDLVDKEKYDLLIVDLPASGHALSFFRTPLGIDKVFSVGFVHKETQKICNLFKDPKARVDFVVLPEEMSVIETLELKTKMQDLWPYPFGYVHLNQCHPKIEIDIEAAVPESFERLVTRYKETFASQKEAKQLADKMELTHLEIPRFPTSSLKETILKVKGALK